MANVLLRQIVIASGPLVTMLAIGMCLGFTTCLLPALKDPASPIRATLEESSWIAASFSSAWIPGFIMSSYFMDRYGRKMAYILDLIPGALGLLLMYFSVNFYCLLAARVLEGITTGATTILGAIVIGEYTSPVYRGMFLNLKTASVYVGSTIVHFLGHHYHWRTVAALTLIPYLSVFVIVFTWPESPYWLASKKRFDKSTKVFYKLRGMSEESTKELNDMIKAQEDRIEPEKVSLVKDVQIYFKKFGKRNFMMPVLNSLFAAILLETTARHVFPSYAVQIISEISGSQGTSLTSYYTLGLDILVTIAATFSSYLMKIIKRRTLLFSTGFLAVLVLLIACGYLLLASRQIIPNTPWIPMGLFSVYFVIVNLACAPIPLALFGEIFPLEHRGSGTTIAGILLSLVTIVTLKCTPVLLETVKVYGTFTILGVVMGLSLICLYFTLPETKDRTLQEIEESFNRKKFRVEVKDYSEEQTKMIAK